MSILVKLLSNKSYNTLIERLLGEKQVYAPVKKGKHVYYNRIQSVSEMNTEDLLPVLSPKSLLFPPVETLFTYERKQDGVNISNADVKAYPERVVFGVRPCDARGLAILRQTFVQEPVDQLFEARFSKTTFIGLSCATADEACFCGNRAGDSTGSDILLTEVSNGDYLAEIITEKGQRLMERYAELFETPAELPDKAAFVATVRGLGDSGNQSNTGGQSNVGNQPNTENQSNTENQPNTGNKSNVGSEPLFVIKDLPERLKALFESSVFEQQSLACIGCGTCTYVCPVCGCFDMQDETQGTKGRRVRCWDSCGFSCFTVHTSGHNPRGTQGQRWRQRIMHKFSYLPESNHVFGCVGCGRCIRSCPAGLDIAKLITQLAHVQHNQ